MDTDNHTAAEQMAEREALLCKANEVANQSLKTEVSQFWKKSFHITIIDTSKGGC